MSPSEPRLELARRAQRDARRLDNPTRGRILSALDQLAADAENLDVKALAGASPWLRLRVGDWRVIYRPLTTQEHPAGGILVARIINRRDLERAIRSLTA